MYLNNFSFYQVTASGLGLYQAKVGQVSTFSIDTLGRPAREFDVVVSGPGGIALPVRYVCVEYLIPLTCSSEYDQN